MKKHVLTANDLGHAVRAARKSHGIRLDDLAKVLGVSKQTTSNVELGKPTVQVGTVLRHLQGMGIHVYLDIPDTAKQEFEKLLAAIEDDANK